MRIISKFRDYYDGVQGYGFDDRIIYVRETVENALGYRTASLRSYGAHNPDPPESFGLETLTDARPKLLLATRHIFELDYVSEGLVCLAGRGYPFWSLERSEESVAARSFEEGFADQVDQVLSSGWRHASPMSSQDWPEWLAEHWGREINPEIHFKVGAPIALWQDGVWTSNPSLRDLSFHKVLDPYFVFQEIETFLAGVMAENRDPPSPMTDREKVVSHGMDVKRSFRKMPRD